MAGVQRNTVTAVPYGEHLEKAFNEAARRNPRARRQASIADSKKPRCMQLKRGRCIANAAVNNKETNIMTLSRQFSLISWSVQHGDVYVTEECKPHAAK
jgi:hypothetical protein